MNKHLNWAMRLRLATHHFDAREIAEEVIAIVDDMEAPEPPPIPDFAAALRCQFCGREISNEIAWVCCDACIDEMRE